MSSIYNGEIFDENLDETDEIKVEYEYQSEKKLNHEPVQFL